MSEPDSAPDDVHVSTAENERPVALGPADSESLEEDTPSLPYMGEVIANQHQDTDE